MAVRLVVLASDRGSNFKALAEGIRSGEIANAQIVGLITHNPKAPALERAREFNVPTFIVENKGNRVEYDERLATQIEALKPDFICLAGYMRIVGDPLLNRWPDRMLNIHPSILPAFRGLKAQQQALDSGVTRTGCTVHFVTAELDGGPIVLQEYCDILPNDTEETLSARLLPIEHRLYVKAVQKLVTLPYDISGGRVIFKS